MKKIAFMFAAAAMFVACQEAPKTATQEQKDSIYALVVAEAQAAAEADAVAAVNVEDLQIAEDATEEVRDSIINAAKEAAKAAVGVIDTTNAAVKAVYEEAVAAFEAALNAPAESEAATEEAAE